MLIEMTHNQMYHLAKKKKKKADVLGFYRHEWYTQAFPLLRTQRITKLRLLAQPLKRAKAEFGDAFAHGPHPRPIQVLLTSYSWCPWSTRKNAEAPAGLGMSVSKQGKYFVLSTNVLSWWDSVVWILASSFLKVPIDENSVCLPLLPGFYRCLKGEKVSFFRRRNQYSTPHKTYPFGVRGRGSDFNILQSYVMRLASIE